MKTDQTENDLSHNGHAPIGIVIVAHGGLAREYLSAIEHVVGPQDGIRAVTIEEDHDRADKQAEICTAADDVDEGAGVVVVTDLFGGSPSNLSLLACAVRNRTILYGANLPMLVKLAKCRQMTVGDAVETAKEAGRKYINSYHVKEDPARTLSGPQRSGMVAHCGSHSAVAMAGGKSAI